MDGGNYRFSGEAVDALRLGPCGLDRVGHGRTICEAEWRVYDPQRSFATEWLRRAIQRLFGLARWLSVTGQERPFESAAGPDVGGIDCAPLGVCPPNCYAPNASVRCIVTT
jgi:hypothetical protein